MAEVDDIITKFLTEKVNTELVFLKKPVYLECINSVWQRYYRSIQLLTQIFLYLQNKYLNVTSQEDFYCINITRFRDLVTLDSRMHKMQHDDLSSSIEENRNKNIPNEMLIRMTCNMLMSVDLGSRNVYKNIFESPFLQRSANYFTVMSNEWMENNPSLEYIKKIDTIIYEETTRAQICFHPSSGPVIVDMLHHILIENKAYTIIVKDSFLWNLLEQENLTELKYLFHMMSRATEGLKAMVEGFRSYLRNKGMVYINELNTMTPRGSKEIYAVTQKIIHLKNFCDNLVALFDHSVDFELAVNVDFEYLLNTTEKSPEYIAHYFHSFLKKDAKKMSQYDVDHILKEAFQLFRYLDGKDIFERYYRQHLATRLLLNKSLGDDMEYKIIYKFKDECGHSFIQKMKSMMIDLATSQNIDQRIREDQLFLENIHEGFDFNITLINRYNWPINSDNCNEYIPLEFRSAFEFYKLFYRSIKKGRKLNINLQLGNAELIVHFEDQGTDRSCALDVATNQMCVLLLFNIKPMWTFLEIQEEIKYDSEALERCLHKLCIGESNQCVLHKHPCTEVFYPSDSFTVNENFSPPKLRLKIQAAAGTSSRTTKRNSRKRTLSDVYINRSLEIQAAIMRVLKHHDCLYIDDIVELVVEQCVRRFRPSKADIIKEIASLVERDYIKPDENNQNTYIYIP